MCLNHLVQGLRLDKNLDQNNVIIYSQNYAEKQLWLSKATTQAQNMAKALGIQSSWVYRDHVL